MKPTREQIEEFRKEHHIAAHLGETPDAGLEPWAVMQNAVLEAVCDAALAAYAAPQPGKYCCQHYAMCIKQGCTGECDPYPRSSPTAANCSHNSKGENDVR